MTAARRRHAVAQDVPEIFIALATTWPYARWSRQELRRTGACPAGWAQRVERSVVRAVGRRAGGPFADGTHYAVASPVSPGRPRTRAAGFATAALP
jgi:hypothetical protein